MRVVRRNVKYPRIDLRDGEITIIAPPGADVDKILKEKKEWIERNMNKINSMITRAEEEIEAHGVMILDRPYKIIHNCKNVGLAGDRIMVCRKRAEYLRSKLREILKMDLEKMVNRYSAILGVKPQRIYIREQVTKWGSCSSRKNLSFNLSLIFLPEKFRESVVAHETVHLIHPNHGKGFRDSLSKLGVYLPSREEMLYYWYYSQVAKKKLYLT